MVYRRYASLFFLVGVDDEEVDDPTPLRRTNGVLYLELMCPQACTV